MMTQTAPAGDKHFVMTMIEHMDFCAQMGRAYGNDRFESLHPYDEVLYAVANHDRGWDDYDQQPIVDPQSGLPFIMAKTPPQDAVATNKGSPDFNELHHPYSGLLSSMHTWGLYNKRYGFSRFMLRDPAGHHERARAGRQPRHDRQHARRRDQAAGAAESKNSPKIPTPARCSTSRASSRTTSNSSSSIRWRYISSSIMRASAATKPTFTFR